jgi:3-oxoacyl-[acyl-carrier-protein] synthase II
MLEVPKHRVAVTSLGIVSPLGAGVSATAESLRAGRDSVSPVTAFDVSQTRCKTAGLVDLTQLSPAESRHEKRLHPASRMMIAALRELHAADPKFRPEQLVIGTTSGGMSYGEAFFRSLASGKSDRRRAAWLANYAPQKPVVDACAALGFSAPSQIIANACASGSNAVGHAFTLIRSGQKRRVLCGGYDALSEMVFIGFDCLQASTAEKIRPFDKDRTGLVLGEGAGLLALENWDDARARGAEILAEVTGYGIATDNYHLTQPNPSGIGPRLAMQRALASAGKLPGEVDYINAHGTATIFNDATEGLAISQLCPGVAVSSTKSMMGHSLGAAGAIEAVFSVLALQQQFLPPNLHHRASDPAWNFQIVARQARAAALDCVLSNSFGFGGTNATVAFGRAG